MRYLFFLAIYLFCFSGPLSGQSKYEIPPKQFLGAWVVKKAIYHPPEGAAPQAVIEKLPDQEYLFKKGKKQALYRYFSDSKKSEYGITVLEVTKTKLVFRSWSAHPANRTIITLGKDGTAVVREVYAKGSHTLHLQRSKKIKTSKKVETNQSSTAFDPKLGIKEKSGLGLKVRPQ